MRTGTLAGLATAGLAAGALVTRAAQTRPEVHDLRGASVLVTGGNSGIGLETCVALARGGARVLLGARDPGRGRMAVEQVRERAASRAVELVPLDLGDLASVRTAAADVASRVDALDVLVHNAGALIGTRTRTVDGFETTIGVNHLGPFLLTHELAPVLVAAPAARVVTVASLAHRRGELDLDDLMFDRRPYQPMVVYGTSKLANVLFARELAARVAHLGITSNSLHPGTIRSGFGRNTDGHWLLRLGVQVAAPLFVDAERGASTSVHLAGAPEVAGVTGHYFSRRRIVAPSAAARDDGLAVGLWRRSADLVGVREDHLDAITRAD